MRGFFMGHTSGRTRAGTQLCWIQKPILLTYWVSGSPSTVPRPMALLLGWPKSLFSFFHKIKDKFFIFTNNFIDLDILSMSAISCYWPLVGRVRGCC